MTEHDKNPTDTETILMALDQISQTIDVMTSVVRRLRNYLEEQESESVSTDTAQTLLDEARASKLLH